MTQAQSRNLTMQGSMYRQRGSLVQAFFRAALCAAAVMAATSAYADDDGRRRDKRHSWSHEHHGARHHHRHDHRRGGVPRYDRYARDYYSYYPRYRYYGPAPVDAHATVTLTLPLF
jgi:hypothetical protein